MADKPNFLKLRVYRLAEELANEVWELIQRWDTFTKQTTGRQVMNSADGVGSNIAEGAGRWNYQDNRRFVRIARGSLYETWYWLRQADRRKLIPPDRKERISKILHELAPRLNAYHKSIGLNGRSESTGSQTLATDN